VNKSKHRRVKRKLEKAEIRLIEFTPNNKLLVEFRGEFPEEFMVDFRVRFMDWLRDPDDQVFFLQLTNKNRIEFKKVNQPEDYIEEETIEVVTSLDSKAHVVENSREEKNEAC